MSTLKKLNRQGKSYKKKQGLTLKIEKLREERKNCVENKKGKEKRCNRGSSPEPDPYDEAPEGATGRGLATRN
ncbi:hypothetical protein CHS0354_022757 [Potamilus streckersoni]|uniref:Uncharacterized protein n=1 Tax=Potamilus streckersoni TaxID=2493646 RepID=A0AAE0VJK6_9BIVA|nr:hypothetical protein CHS0354_022757 [Potamilus streckersoni]